MLQFFRHGDRVPSRYLYLPTDPQPHVPWPGGGIGALTLVGWTVFNKIPKMEASSLDKLICRSAPNMNINSVFNYEQCTANTCAQWTRMTCSLCVGLRSDMDPDYELGPEKVFRGANIFPRKGL